MVAGTIKGMKMKYIFHSCDRRNQYRSNGFTLVELMIAVVILGVVMAIAVPSYRSYVTKSHRSEAIQALTQYQTIIERCYAANLTYLYSAANCPAMLTAATNSAHGYYSINVSNVTTVTYTLTATAQNGQLGDPKCATLVIDQTNTKTSTGTPINNDPSCWNP
jgi:type IV pilus assembly protein PilE